VHEVEITIRAKRDDDRGWLTERLEASWGSARMVSNGKLYDVRDQAGLIAEIGGEPAGMLMYHVEGGECEIRLLESFRPGIGIGGRLIRAVIDKARQAGCSRLWVVTTNGNTHALRFYQMNGFHLHALRANALEASRKIKPEIPVTGIDGIPLRDEIELSMAL
jgi:ribosomal protein S18 acetylase RimI-like enzyme